jgi:3-oxoacyl-[acyl-carrier-protein] synthase II
VVNSTVDGGFDMRKWGTHGMQLVTPLWLLKYLPNMLPCHVGIIHDIQGPSNTITCAESSALIALSEARQVVLRGDADIALAGGAEAKVNPIVMLRQILLKRSTITSNDDPAGACRPFDANASGSVFGEGAALMVLEERDYAVGHGAKIHAELVGCGESISLNPHYEKLEDDGAGLQIAIEKAIEEAGIEPGELDLVVPHGTGIPDEDAIESMVLERVLGKDVSNVPVWPTKSMLSVTGAASSGLDLIAAVRAITSGIIPKAKNCDKRAEGCNLSIVSEPLKKDVRYALCCSYSYCGHTAAAVVKKYEK